MQITVIEEEEFEDDPREVEIEGILFERDGRSGFWSVVHKRDLIKYPSLAGVFTAKRFAERAVVIAKQEG